jgi:uncharacterized protein (DUF1697 family)
MATHVALLRGINVGGRNKIAMADLRTAVGSLGYEGVSTYIQSGNVLFSAQEPDADTTALEAAIGAEVARSFSIKTGIVVVSRDQLAEVISQNPYPDEPNPKYLHAVFMSTEPDKAQRDRLAGVQATVLAAKGGRDALTVIGRTMYLHTPDGFGTSELAKALLRLPGGGTARNWSTTTKLLSLCDS